MSYIDAFMDMPYPTFTYFFSSADQFIEGYKESAFGAGTNVLSDSTLTQLFYLLYARYGNSHTYYTDSTQFKYNVYSLVFMYGPTWEKRIELQSKLRALKDDELTEGTTATHTHADNPGTLNLDSINYIDSENKTKYKKSKIEGIAMAEQLLTADVTRDFLNKFAKLFIRIIGLYEPIYFKDTDISIEGDDE